MWYGNKFFKEYFSFFFFLLFSCILFHEQVLQQYKSEDEMRQGKLDRNHAATFQPLERWSTTVFFFSPAWLVPWRLVEARVDALRAACLLTETAQCPECGRWMTTYNLRRHYRDQHMPNQASRCPHCGKMFRNLSSMQSHKSKYHRGSGGAGSSPVPPAPPLAPPLAPASPASASLPLSLPGLVAWSSSGSWAARMASEQSSPASTPAPTAPPAAWMRPPRPPRPPSLQHVPPPVQLESLDCHETQMHGAEHDIRRVSRTVLPE